MHLKSYKEFIVWQKGHQLVLNVYRITNTFPHEEKFGIISQIRRSSVSICANFSEGYRKSRKDFSRYLDISLGSLEETKYYLELSKDLHYISQVEYDDLLNKAEEVGRMLHSLNQKLRN